MNIDFFEAKQYNFLVVPLEIKTRLKMKCRFCGHWNRITVTKIFIEQPSPEPKVKILVPMYKPLQVTKCKKSGKVIAEPKELIRIRKGKFNL